MKNINTLKEHKNKNFLQSKYTIASIYDKMNVSRLTNRDMGKLCNLGALLNSATRHKFKSDPTFSEFLQNMNLLNGACVDFHDQVKCYKNDLAQSL